MITMKILRGENCMNKIFKNERYICSGSNLVMYNGTNIFTLDLFSSGAKSFDIKRIQHSSSWASLPP